METPNKKRQTPGEAYHDPAERLEVPSHCAVRPSPGLAEAAARLLVMALERAELQPVLHLPGQAAATVCLAQSLLKLGA